MRPHTVTHSQDKHTYTQGILIFILTRCFDSMREAAAAASVALFATVYTCGCSYSFASFSLKKNDLLYLYIRDTLYLSSSPSFISLMHSFHVCFGNLWTIGGLLKTVKILNVSYVPNCFFFFFFGSVHPSIITSDGCDSAEGGCNVECQLCASPFCNTRVFLHSDDLLSAHVSTGATASQRPAFGCELS